MKKQRLASSIMVLAMVVALISLVSCGGKSAKADVTASSKDSKASELVVRTTGLPIVDEPLTYEFAANTRKNKNFKELEFFQRLEESTNVRITWNMSPEDGWTEKKSLLFASNILPDVFYGQDILTDVDIIRYGAEGLLIPLNDLIDTYAPNLKAIFDANPQYKKQITAPDGNIYTLPTINELNPTTHDHLFINKNWLANLGLEIPNTKEEFEAVLQAFKDYDANGNGDPNDEIPFSFRQSANDPYNRQQGVQSMFGIFGQLDDIFHFIVDDNGKVIFTPTTTPYRDAIQWFHSLYKKGLIDKEVFTHNANVYVAKIQDPGDIVGMWLGWSRNATAAANKDNYVVMAPLINVNGERIWRRVDAKLLSKGSFAITNKAKHPEVLVRWMDESYEGVTSLEICQGLLGHALEETADGRFQQMKLPAGMVLDTVIHDYSPGNDGTFALMNPTIERLILNANLQERRELDAFYEPYNVPASNMYPNVFFSEDEVERIAELKTDIDAYVMQKYAAWIVEGGVEREWDAFQKKLKDMKVDEYISYYAKAYERYLKD